MCQKLNAIFKKGIIIFSTKGNTKLPKAIKILEDKQSHNITIVLIFLEFFLM